MHRSLAPPRPHLLRDERQDGRKQSQLHGECRSQRCLRRRFGGRSLTAVCPFLDQLDVVVAEAPEEGLGDLEGAGVVVRLERFRRAGDDPGELGQQRAVDRLGDLGRVRGLGGSIE